uniref:hypothetical protein n=1 Tax=Bacillus sp. DX2.2 TaxID=3073452 RepID=UPI00402AFA5A
MDVITIIHLLCSLLIFLAVIVVIKNAIFTNSNSNKENVKPENFSKEFSLDLDIVKLLIIVTIFLFLPIIIRYKDLYSYATTNTLLTILVIVGAVESIYYLFKNKLHNLRKYKLLFKLAIATIISLISGMFM